MNLLFMKDGSRSTTSTKDECWQSSSREYWRRLITSQVLHHAGSVNGKTMMLFDPVAPLVNM